MTIKDLYKIKREGILPSDEIIHEFESYSQQVRIINKMTFEADDAFTAACWLLSFCNNKYTINNATTKQPVLGFRGQFAKFTNLLPSICRLEKGTRNNESLAVQWFGHFINEIYINNFNYIADIPHLLPFDIEDTQMIAQHYQMGTSFIDWTWDPLIAIIFSLYNLQECEYTQVLIDEKKHNSLMEFMLPPTFCERVWIQKGYFQQLACPDTNNTTELLLPLLNRSSLKRHSGDFLKIRFKAKSSEIDFAKEYYKTLLFNNDPIIKIKKRSYEIVELLDPELYPMNFYTSYYEYPLEILRETISEYKNFEKFTNLRMKEDIKIIENYIKTFSIRKYLGRYVIYLPILVAMRKKMMNSLTCPYSNFENIFLSDFLLAIEKDIKERGTSIYAAEQFPIKEY